MAGSDTEQDDSGLIVESNIAQQLEDVALDLQTPKSSEKTSSTAASPPSPSPARPTPSLSPPKPPAAASPPRPSALKTPLLRTGAAVDAPPPRSPKRLSARGGAPGSAAPGVARSKPVGSVGAMKGMFEAKAADSGSGLGGLAPSRERGTSKSPPKRVVSPGKAREEKHVQKAEEPKTPPPGRKGKEVEKAPADAQAQEAVNDKAETTAPVEAASPAKSASSPTKTAEEEPAIEASPGPASAETSAAQAEPVVGRPSSPPTAIGAETQTAVKAEAAASPAASARRVDTAASAISSPLSPSPSPSPGTAIQPTFASRSSSHSSLRSFQGPSFSAQPRLDDALSLSDARTGDPELADEAVEDLAPVDLDDVPLDADAKDDGKTPTFPEKSTGGLFGGKLGFLSRSSSGASGPPPTASSSNWPGTPSASRLERTASSSSSLSLTESSAPVKIEPPPAPARSVSSSWRTGLTALLGGSSPNAAASSSAAQPIDSHSPRETALSGGRLAPSSFPRPTLVAAGSSRLLASENAARRDLAAASQGAMEDDLVHAEDFEETDDWSGDETTATPRKRGRRRSEKSAEEDVVEDGIVGGVDWSFWGAVMSDYEDVARTRPKELSKAIQQGIPAVIRGTMWQLMSSSKSTELESRYSALLKLASPHEKSIQKDLARTFPSHAYFQQAGGVGQENLFNVVKAYSLYDPDVGYTQGLAFIVAPLLLLMPEEEAFCVLVRLMESYDLRSHFLPEMPGLQMRLYQFDRLVEELLPVLHLHFVRKGVKSSMFASQWFMTMFSYRFPLALVFRIYDIVFAEGIEAVFRFSLALLQKNEAHIVTLDFEGCLKYLQAGLFETYKQTEIPDQEILEEDHLGQGEWQANAFVEDAYAMRISPFMLDNYAGEHFEQIRALNAHAVEMDVLRNANRNLSSQVKSLEAALASMNSEHVELVRQLVNSRIEKEEIENELVKYKVLYAELSHNQQESASPLSKRPDSRSSSTSTTRKLSLWA